MKRNVIFYSFIIFVCFLLSSCLSPYSGPEEETTITITLGSPGNSRILVGNAGATAEFLRFEHELYFNGVFVPVTVATDTDGAAPIMTLTATVTFAPSNNHISIRAYDPNNTHPNLTSFGPGRILRAVTENPVPISIGQTGVPIPMVSAMEVDNWAQLVQAAAGGPDGTRAEIIFLKNETFIATGEIPVSRPIFLRTLDGDVTINRPGTMLLPFFNVGASGTLTLQGSSGMLTLNGGGSAVTSHSSPLIFVNGGTLEMNGMVHLENNHSMNWGGAVIVNTGSFIMNDGTIEGNRAGTNGGGVVVDSGGTFIMRGGVIRNNTATDDVFSGNGGGVAVLGTFTMEDGQIMNNTALNGGGVAVLGTFTMEGGEISNNTAAGFSPAGGGVFVDAGDFIMNDGEIRNNRSGGFGGGVFVNPPGTFTKNGGDLFGLIGGASQGPNSNILWDGSAFFPPSAGGDGHALYVASNHSVFENGDVPNGGPIWP